MTPESVMTLGRTALEMTILVASPVLLVTLVVGLIVSVFQAATQINDASLSFIPKVIAVLAKDPRWDHIQDIDDIPEYTKKEITHFFEHYKDLEPNKWVKVDEWANAAEAERLVIEAYERFEEHEAQTRTQGAGEAPNTRA